jgi:hypothetical protein
MMMHALAANPALEDLYALIGKIRSYPVSIEKIVDTARRLGAPQDVIEFYASFRPRLTFHDKDELLGCSEQVDIMRAERSDMPDEEERSPEEY